MQITLLEILACPSSLTGKRCAGRLQPAPDPAPRFDPSQDAELTEGLLQCDTCGMTYPVLCGVAMILPDSTGYLQRHYRAILTLALENDLPISPAMRVHLQKIGAHLEPGGRAARSEDDPRALSAYLAAHYDPHPSAPQLPAAHPLTGLLAAYQGHDLYAELKNLFQPHLHPGIRALDIGCHVGRVTRDLCSLGAQTLGIDLSFGAVFLARQAVRAWPHPLDAYEHFRDGALREKRPLSLPLFPQGDVIVASATNLPVVDEAFDVVTCANLVDILPEPVALLREIRRVLPVGGIVTISTPYHAGAAQAAAQWLGPERRLSASQTLRWRIGHHFEISAERDWVPWLLWDHERRLTVYLNHCMVGKKTAVSQK